MNQPFSIVPPPELRCQWLDNDHFPMVTGTHELLSITKDRLNSVMDQAAQWGADMELEAVIDLAGQSDLPEEDRYFDGFTVAGIRAARRPKPPSLKEQALKLLRPLSNPVMPGTPEYRLYEPQAEIIRRALEAPND
jgi:hypothetical protein